MTISSKSESTRLFLELVAIEAAKLGFVQKPRNVLLKPCIDENILSVRYEFFGSAIVDAVAYVGVRLPSVEKRLSDMAFFKGWPSSTVRETVFQKIDTVIKLIAQEHISSSVRLPDSKGDQIAVLKRYAVDLTATLCDAVKLAAYCIKDTSLPVGHHAFRVPFILRNAGMEDSCQSYMAGVIAKGFVNGYEDFISEFNKLQ